MQRCYSTYASRLAALVVLLAATAVATRAGEWPSFRGPNRTGVSPETGLLQKWPEGGPPLAWKVEGTGRGYSSLAIDDHHIYTLGDGLSASDDKDEYLICLDRQSGKQLWTTKTGSPWNSGDSTWQGSRSTPTVDADRVYVITPFGDLYCCDTTTGARRWHKNLKSDFSGEKGDGWGYSESVLIDGDKLVCTPGGETNTMVALNKKTGEQVWKTSRKDDRGAGHASIVVSEVGGVRVYVQTTASGGFGVRQRRSIAVDVSHTKCAGGHSHADCSRRFGFYFDRLSVRRRAAAASAGRQQYRYGFRGVSTTEQFGE